MANDLIDHGYEGSLHKISKGWGSESLWVGEHMQVWEEWSAWRGHGSSVLLALHISSIWLFLTYIPLY